MSRSFRVDIELAESRHEDVALSWGGWSSQRRRDVPGFGWDVELPVVVRLLEAIERGRTSAAEARAELLAAAQACVPHSGCCPRCEDRAEGYRRALAEFEQARRRFADSVRYPFLVNSGVLHRWDCATVPGAGPTHPGRSLQQYVHEARYSWHPGQRRLSDAEASRLPPERHCVTCRPLIRDSGH
ncbi:hypothetical protein [Crossiella sp. NPDC003009]